MHFATSHGTWHVTTERQRAAGRTGARKRLQKGPKLKANHISQIRQEKAQAQWNRENFVFMEFIRIFNEERDEFQKQRRLKSLLRKGQAKTTFTMLNRGYTEEEEEYEAEANRDVEFQDEWRKKSIVEDYWKADDYVQTFKKLRKDPDRSMMEHMMSNNMFTMFTYDLEQQKPWPRLGARTDRFVDVLRDAAAAEVLDHERPVLTHELADFANPYMMKRSAAERLLHERCVRNALDERVMPRLLDAQADLLRLRREAPMPPEVLEPLAAFRGDVRWSFDSRERLRQKLRGINVALDAIKKEEDVMRCLPENQVEDPAPDQLAGVHHPWRNHLGFESAVPKGTAGGITFGQPEKSLSQQLAQMRYPTLQRVAHTLPRDPKYRSHVARSIRVLERNRYWDYQSKLNAINRMKETYDYLKPSEEYTEALDEKLVVNRVFGKIRRKYAPDAEYVKTYPKNFLKEKSYYWYRPSLFPQSKISSKKKPNRS
ncbi:Uncharacterized protein SCF082_LOCUS8373 [Durusdinium trenchii]|uniref:Uncharacterized protein n=1 Tax=Durusdinium trenchii TaxID=1381693 RepID=A0ABP0IRH2_9DINO